MRRRPLLMAGLVAVALWAAAGCQPIQTTHGSYRAGTLTPDGEDRYLITDRGNGFDVSAPTSNKGSDLRRAVVPDAAPISADHGACITWNGPPGRMIQPGLVLRAELGASYTRAIMVTNNITFGARTGFNIHVADSRADPRYRAIGQVTLPDSVGPNPMLQEPLPWRLCARVSGTRLDLKVWPTAKVSGEPAWSDTRYTRTISVPSDWVYPGKPGFYVGHLSPGESTAFRNPEIATGPSAAGA